MGEEVLKACPFCGSPAYAVPQNQPYRSKWPEGRVRVHCSNGFLEGGPCDAAGPMQPSAEQAIAAWNTRPSPSMQLGVM